MAYTTIDNPELYFQTKLYTGTGSSLAITLDGSENMQPDWVWIKNRNLSGGYGHNIFDSVRGVNKKLVSNATSSESSLTSTFNSFDTDGFTLGADSQTDEVNKSSASQVAWCWKAGTSFTNDASSTGIGSIDSAGSVNTDAGFSITSYTGTGSAATVAHGLGVAPSVYILKNRTSTSNWFVYHKSTGATKSLFLDGTDAPITSSGYFNNTEPTSSVFSIGSESDLSGSSQNMIAYCFAEKKGYSKFGSYTGNGNTDGTFVYCGFRPAFLLWKQTNTGGQTWGIFDNKRDPHNFVSLRLPPDTTDSEGSPSAAASCDFLSNGFKWRSSFGSRNGSGGTYIFMAFAENPFVTSTGIPTTAR